MNVVASSIWSQGGTIIYLVAIVAMMIFFFRSNSKQQKAHQQLINSVEVGDSVSTVSGFYGVVVDVMGDVVIVEFGNNENCRIPMKKAAIDGIEKPKQVNEEMVEIDEIEE